jgi:hypothetical protein
MCDRRKDWARQLLSAALIIIAVPALAVNLPTTALQVTANSSGVASFDTDSAIVTTASLSTAAGASASFTIGSPSITPSSIIQTSLANGTNSAGLPAIETATPGNATVTIVIFNDHATNAFNGTLKIGIIVFN